MVQVARLPATGRLATRKAGKRVSSTVTYLTRATALALLAFAAGCSSSGDHSKPAAAAKPRPPAATCDPGDDSCIPPASPTASAPTLVPAAQVGHPLHLQLPTSGGTAQVTLTLTGTKLKGRQLCFGAKIRNVGALAWKPDDTTASIDWTWFGLDGQQADTGPGTAGQCDELGRQFAGVDQPAPLPGKDVRGYYGLEVPAKPGALEVTDSTGSPLFRLNYERQSARAPIPAGQ